MLSFPRTPIAAADVAVASATIQYDEATAKTSILPLANDGSEPVVPTSKLPLASILTRSAAAVSVPTSLVPNTKSPKPPEAELVLTKPM